MADQIFVPEEDPVIVTAIGAGPVATTTFALTFFDVADIKVYVDAVLQVADVDYVLTPDSGYDDGYPGGSIAWTVAKSNVTVVILRDQERAFSPVFGSTGAFDPTRFNVFIEQLWAALQETESQVARCLRVELTNEDGELVTIGTISARAGKVTYYDADGQPALSTVDWADVEAFVSGAADIAADVAAAAASAATAAAEAAAAAASAVAAAASAASIALPIPIGSGGTGQTTAALARTALAVPGLAVANTFTADQTIQSVDAGAGAGPLLLFDRNSASPAANDLIGEIRLRGRNSIAATKDYVEFTGIILDATSGSEDSAIRLVAFAAGASAVRWYLGQSIFASGLADTGNGTVNWNNAYQAGQKIQPVLQRIVVTDATFTASAATTPAYDDTQPLVTEGTQIFSQSITAKISTSTIRIRSWLMQSSATGSVITNQIHIAGADAISVGCISNVGTGVQSSNLAEHDYAPGDTAAHTISIRGGSQSATGYNGSQAGGARKFGGFTKQFLELTEIAA